MEKRQTNCPNCGAVIQGSKCEYCGTLFYDFTELDLGNWDKPVMIKINNYGQEIYLNTVIQKLDYSHSYYDSYPEVNLNGIVLTMQKKTHNKGGFYEKY